MRDKVRVNIANSSELLEIPGIDTQQAERIIRFRAEHGPISGVSELTRILGGGALTDALTSHVDFAPAGDTAPEAPGA
jgi:DNA uptake protein ComE-like DNA-binding protein